MYEAETRISPFDLAEVSEFLCSDGGTLAKMFACDEDRAFARECCRLLIDRAAKMGAIANAAAALRCGKAEGLPVAIVAEGTTFNKLPDYKAKFVGYLEEILSPLHISFEIVQGEDVNLVGTLLATLA